MEYSVKSDSRGSVFNLRGDLNPHSPSSRLISLS